MCESKKMSKLSESIFELMSENGLDQKTFAAKVGISASRMTDYIKHEKLPTVENLIKIADYFHCSTDFLLGREEYNPHEKFQTPVPFRERIGFLRKYFNKTLKQIYADTDIPKSSYYEWIKGESEPSLDNIIKFADLFQCRVDFVLGRET